MAGAIERSCWPIGNSGQLRPIDRGYEPTRAILFRMALALSLDSILMLFVPEDAIQQGHIGHILSISAHFVVRIGKPTDVLAVEIGIQVTG